MERDHKLTIALQKALANSLNALGWSPADIAARTELDSTSEEAVFVTLYLPEHKPFLSGPEYRTAHHWIISILAERQIDRPVYLRLAGQKEQAA
ncbi:MAG: hypothetical protein RL145_1666 [Pseudomonadota bacterium]|jgi:hypothetical protein